MKIHKHTCISHEDILLNPSEVNIYKKHSSICTSNQAKSRGLATPVLGACEELYSGANPESGRIFSGAFSKEHKTTFKLQRGTLSNKIHNQYVNQNSLIIL